MIAYAQKLERIKLERKKKLKLYQRNYSFEELKQCSLCLNFIELKYVKICCLYFHKDCLIENIQDS